MKAVVFLLAIIGALLVVVAFFGTAWFRPKLLRGTPARGHLAPAFAGYKGGWTTVVRCLGCGQVGLFEDLPVGTACEHCGSLERDERTGKWTVRDDVGWWQLKGREGEQLPPELAG